MGTDALLLAIDQGTTSSRAIVFDQQGEAICTHAQEFSQIYPKPGWVEHDAERIWETTFQVCKKALGEGHLNQVVAIGITNQRETVVLWDKNTGKPIANAIVWQDRRTADFCAKLKADGHEPMVQHKTGLLLDPYFSATKIAWLLNNVAGAREKANAGQLLAGTIDSFLLWNLTGMHATDATNASRTMLYNIRDESWDEELLKLFNIPQSLLPEVRDCVADFGQTKDELFGRTIPVRAMIGDQQSATVGQACFEPGMMKSTYGTGCFAIVNTGNEIVESKNRLLATIALSLNGKTHYALEGSIFIAGALIQWLRDGLGLIKDASETQALAESVEDSAGVYIVPAFTGLGAPYWDAEARGAIVGLTRGAGKAEIIRAALEAQAYQTNDLISAMEADGVEPTRLRVDGGMVKNDWLCQDLANVLNVEIDRPSQTETTALGAAMLAALGAGLFSSLEEIAQTWKLERSFSPDLSEAERKKRLSGWKIAVKQVQAGH
ncbi:MAG: glycerol kinase GlpK [Sphingomonadales bacterium]|jgi:glycerol kinase